MTTRMNKTKIPASAARSDPSPPVRRLPHRNVPLCRTSEYKPPGSDKIGLGPRNQPSKVVWELDYALKPEQFEQLSARFPGIAFVQTGFDCHDHPIAHTSYRIVWENVMKQLHPGWKVADISGNPAYNERFNRAQARRANPITVDTFCRVQCPKDSVRLKTRWGPKMDGDRVRWEEATLNDMYRFPANAKRFALYDCFLMNQCLYYYTKAEVCRLLNLNKQSVLIATIHKLPGREGFINCGEQEYRKDPISGHVTQINVETGEEYAHPDPDPWFRQFSYADESGAIAWTVNKGCDDTYRLTITSTEPGLVPEAHWLDGRIVLHGDCGVAVADPVEVEVPPPAYPVEEVAFETRDLLPLAESNKRVTITITHPKLYSTLRSFMINKPRNHRTLQDLTAKAHREVGNNTLIGTSQKIDIDPGALTRHIFAAWMSGVAAEADLFTAAVSSTYADAVNRNLTGKTLSIGRPNVLKQFTRFALSAAVVSSSKQPVRAVLAEIDELL